MQPHAEASLLQRRFRQVATAVGLLIVVALALLIWREYRVQIGRELAVREVAARERLVAVEGVVTAADVHVKAMRFAVEAALAFPSTRAPPVPAATPVAGGPPVDFYGEPSADKAVRAGIVMAAPEALPRLGREDRELAALPDLFLIAASAQRAQPFLRWSFYFSARRDLVAIYPWATPDTFVGTTSRRRVFDGYFTYPVYTMTERPQDPARDAVWTPAYFDAGNAGLMVSHAAPVDRNGQQVGMVGTDVLVSVLSDRLWRGEEADGLTLVAEANGTLVADSRHFAARAAQLTNSAALLPVAFDALRPGLFQRSGDWYVLVLAVQGSPWRFVSAVPRAAVQGFALRQILPYVLYLLLLGAVLTAAFAAIGRRFIAPAFTLAATVERLALNRSAADGSAVPALWRPWINRLHEAFRREREAADRLREAERKASAIIDVALEAVVTADGEGRIVDFNPAAEAMFALPASAAKGRTVGETIVPPHLRGRHEAGMARQERTGVPHVLGRRMELEALRADGTVFPAEIQIHKLDVTGVRYAAYIRDLTQQKRAEAEVASGREKLHQAEKLAAMGSLLAGVAHEINNPLAVVVAQAGLLEEMSPDPRTRASAGKIGAAATRCGRVVKTFLSMARRQTPQRGAVDLREVVAASAGVVAYTLRSSGVELTQEHAPDLPAIEADAVQLGQVVSNLLLNAAQALGDADGPRRITVSTARHGARSVRLTVADNGPGIPAPLRERIFEAFFTTKPAGIGTGIGLAICRSVVEAHGGTIEAGAREGGGAAFHIVLPAWIAGREASPPAQAPPPAAGATATGLLILVVDDEPEVAAALAAFLRHDGHDVAARSGVGDGLAAAAEHDFDMVFCDVRMPDGGGTAFVRALAERNPALAGRVVLVTGDMVAGPDHVRRALPERTPPIMEKPFTLADVRRAVDLVADFA